VEALQEYTKQTKRIIYVKSNLVKRISGAPFFRYFPFFRAPSAARIRQPKETF
jgi:hypothetical protein